MNSQMYSFKVKFFGLFFEIFKIYRLIKLKCVKPI